MVRLILEPKALADTDLGPLRLILHGAAPMPADLAAQARSRLGVALQTIFGITEGGGPVITLRARREARRRPGGGRGLRRLGHAGHPGAGGR